MCGSINKSAKRSMLELRESVELLGLTCSRGASAPWPCVQSMLCSWPLREYLILNRPATYPCECPGGTGLSVSGFPFRLSVCRTPQVLFFFHTRPMVHVIFYVIGTSLQGGCSVASQTPASPAPWVFVGRSRARRRTCDVWCTRRRRRSTRCVALWFGLVTVALVLQDMVRHDTTCVLWDLSLKPIFCTMPVADGRILVTISLRWHQHRQKQLHFFAVWAFRVNNLSSDVSSSDVHTPHANSSGDRFSLIDSCLKSATDVIGQCLLVDAAVPPFVPTRVWPLQRPIQMWHRRSRMSGCQRAEPVSCSSWKKCLAEPKHLYRNALGSCRNAVRVAMHVWKR